MAREPDPPTPPAAPAAGEPTVNEVAERQDRIEGKLDTLTEAVSRLVPGAKAAPSQSPPAGTGSPPEAGTDVASQVKAEIDKIEAENKRKAAEQGDQAWRKGVEDKLKQIPETRPAEPRTGFRARLQDAMYGKQD